MTCLNLQARILNRKLKIESPMMGYLPIISKLIHSKHLEVQNDI